MKPANQNRFYVDLMHKTDGRYFNPNPEVKLKLGDYGSLNKNTGELIPSGNIFDEPTNFPELSDTYSSGELNEYAFDERSASTGSDSAERVGAKMEIPSTFAEVDASCEYKLKRGRYAFLFVQTPQLQAINNYGSLKEYLRNQGEVMKILKDKYVVTRVWNCKTYFLHLTENIKSEATIRFRVRIHGADVADAKVSWASSSSLGMSKAGIYKHGEFPYTAMASLELIDKPVTILGIKFHRGDETVANTEPVFTTPWSVQLDEETGEEVS